MDGTQDPVASDFVPKKISSNILPVAASRRNGRVACRVWVLAPTKFRGSIAPIARARCPYMRPTARSREQLIDDSTDLFVATGEAAVVIARKR